MGSNQKPNKPYRTFPLTAHANGQWCKKILGKVHFFGVWDNPDAALARYHEQSSDLHAGRDPRASTLITGRLTVKDICNGFLGWQKDKLEAGELHPRSFKEYLDTVRDFAKALGEHRPVESLRPQDFQRFRSRLATQLAPATLAKRITIIRSVFKYAYDSDLLDRPMKFGSTFSRPSATQLRKARRKHELENGKRLFSREQIHAILDACPEFLRAPIFLGLNGGFGNTDCGTLPISTVQLDHAVIEYDRPKTGVQRVVPLWPETIETLRNALAGPRPKPVNSDAAKLVFLTPAGKPFVRQVVEVGDDGIMRKMTHIDDISDAFAILLRSLGIHRKGLGFYTLRRTFRTLADEIKDVHAIHRIMGHTIPGMGGIYVQEISLDRLRAVVEYVRNWLFD